MVGQTQITISFTLHVGALISSDEVVVTLMVTDENSDIFNIGIVPFDVTNEKVQFSGFNRILTNRLSIYPLLLPMTYTKIENSTTLVNREIFLSVSAKPSALLYTAAIARFSYIYITNAYTSRRVGTLFPDVNQTYYGYLVSYAQFTYTPTDQTIVMAVKTYESTNNPFFKLTAYKDYSSTGSAIDQFIIGYQNQSSVTYMADLFMFNETVSCPDGEYLYYYIFFETLPRTC